MTTSVDLTIDEESLVEALKFFEFVGGNIEDVIRIAINKTGPMVLTRAARAIGKNINLTPQYIKDKVRFYRATRRNLIGTIRTPSRGILMSRFDTNPAINGSIDMQWFTAPKVNPPGIIVQIEPGDSRTLFKGKKSRKAPETEGEPFYVLLKNSRAIGVAKRIKGQRKFHVFHGPSISQVFDRVKDDLLPEAEEIYQRKVVESARYLVTKMNLPPEI